jgi:hypothetical protein
MLRNVEMSSIFSTFCRSCVIHFLYLPWSCTGLYSTVFRVGRLPISIVLLSWKLVTKKEVIASSPTVKGSLVQSHESNTWFNYNRTSCFCASDSVQQRGMIRRSAPPAFLTVIISLAANKVTTSFCWFHCCCRVP